MKLKFFSKNKILNSSIYLNLLKRGFEAGKNFTTGAFNTALGYGALSTGNFTQSTAIGANSSCTASNQIVLGTASETVKHPGAATFGGAVTFGSGNPILSIYSFIVFLGTNASSTGSYTATYGRSYPDNTKLIFKITISNNNNGVATFVSTVKQITTTQIGFNVIRIDGVTGWTGNPSAHITVTQIQ